MLTQIMKHDWRNLSADRTIWAIAALLAVTIGYGALNGSAWARFQRDTLKATAAEEQDRLQSIKNEILEAQAGRTRPTPFADPRSPAAVGRTLGLRYAAMPPGALAALAIGQSDLYPYYFKVSTLSKQNFLNNDEIEHPVHLMSGRFDLAFVILYLYPLIILALSYNIISAEKEAGTLAMTLSHPVTLRRLALGKIGFRFTFVATLAAGLCLIGILLGGADLGVWGAGVRLLLWFAVVIAYGAFWFALAIGIHALGGSSSTNAVALAGLWLTFVLLIPSLLNVAVKYLHPVPSRVELIQAMRDASSEASSKGSRLLSQYFEDHPELSGTKTDADEFGAIVVAAQDEVERRIQPVLEHFDEQLGRQQALIDRYRFLSPAIVAQSSLFDIAGTSIHRYKHFLALADEFHRAWRAYFVPRIMKGEKIAPADVDQFPRFHFREESQSDVVGRAAVGLAGLVIPSAALGAIALWALRRFPIVG